MLKGKYNLKTFKPNPILSVVYSLALNYGDSRTWLLFYFLRTFILIILSSSRTGFYFLLDQKVNKKSRLKTIFCNSTVHDLIPITDLSRKFAHSNYPGFKLVTYCSLSCKPTSQLMPLELQRKLF